MENVEIRGSSILIVDDNPDNLKLLGKLLQIEDYDIEFSTSGEAALDLLEQRRFDLLLLDINMPGLTGFEVCKLVRANPELGGIPIIFLSAESERDTVLKGFELGAQDYVTKPFDCRELVTKVSTHLWVKKSRDYFDKFRNFQKGNGITGNH